MLQNNYVMKAAEKTHDNNSYVMQHPPSHNYVTLNNNNNYVMKASHESGAILPTGFSRFFCILPQILEFSNKF